MQNTNNVTYAKPSVAGAIYVAPVGTELPTNATTELNEAFKSLGYVSEDGLTNSMEMDTESIKAWGGDTVLVVHKGGEDTFSYTLIESLNIDVLKFVYGEENVSGNIDTGLTIKSNQKPKKDVSYVIEMILAGGILKRIVVPQASITEIGEITYKDDDVVGYEVTTLAKPSANLDGDSHREYIQKKG